MKSIEMRLEEIEKSFLALLKELKEIHAGKPREISFKKLNKRQALFLRILSENRNDPLPLKELAYKIGSSSNNLPLHYFKTLEKRGYIEYRGIKDYDIIKISFNKIPDSMKTNSNS